MIRRLTATILPLVVLATAAAPAHAAWDFNTDQRTCKLANGGITVVTNEDECGWPRQVARTAFVYGFPKRLHVGNQIYKRSGFGMTRAATTARYSRGPAPIERELGQTSGIWFNLTARIAA